MTAPLIVSHCYRALTYGEQCRVRRRASL